MKKSEIVAVTLCILALGGLLLAKPVMNAYETHQALSAAHEKASELMAQGRWMEASFALDHYEVYEDLRDYCRAKAQLESGNTLGAKITLDGISPSFQGGDVAALRQEIEADLPAYYERERQKEEQRLQEEKAAARKGVPYVGMDEDWIDITSLGVHDDLRHNNEVKNGEIYQANLYDFENSDGALIFTARCVFGRVTEVWDYRDDPWKGSSYTPTYDPDPYDAKDYSHPDDFYYDHYDDFWDYEDAEDYYYEHCD